ncbi:MAG: winged helix-turn-helix transcriptional regulator [Candidatus Bathyarchaeum sp.]|nr:MAG: winged helix-turn-helix transcriptional regulator [Candidatus Bathyarchaeum sp.]
MPNSEEETYSIMFTSLKHPARRKILRMLSGKPKTFSQILETLGVSSSHLTYHLENLGELVSKMEDGSYRLSTFGEAAVCAMRGVEDVPVATPKHPLALPLQWKSFFAVLMIGVVILAGLSYVQLRNLNHITTEYDKIVTDFNRISAENDRLKDLVLPTHKVFSFLENVVQLNMTKYHARLEDNSLRYPPDFGGIAEETLKYTLTSDQSEINVDFRFRNQTLSRYVLDVLEFAPLYAQPQPTNVLDMASDILQRYQDYSGASYLVVMRDMLSTVNEVEALEKTVGDMKLQILTEGNDFEIQWIHTTSGIDYQSKGVILSFDNGVFETLVDGYYLFNVGSTEISISDEKAINIAMDYAKDFSWEVEGEKVTQFTILEKPVTVSLLPHIREEPLALIPYYYVTLQLDKVYPGDINCIEVGLWADTGEVAHCNEASN